MAEALIGGLFRRAIDTLIFYGALTQYQRGHLLFAAAYLAMAIAPWPVVRSDA